MSNLEHHRERRQQLIERYLPDGTPSADQVWTGGVHHLALICSDVDATIQFYTGVLKMKLNKIVENRDEPTSTHLFFDMGGGNQLAFFDFPDAPQQQGVRGIGSMHHVAIKAAADKYQSIRQTVQEEQIPHSLHETDTVNSIYLRDPDGILIEITTGR